VEKRGSHGGKKSFLGKKGIVNKERPTANDRIIIFGKEVVIRIQLRTTTGTKGQKGRLGKPNMSDFRMERPQGGNLNKLGEKKTRKMRSVNKYREHDPGSPSQSTLNQQESRSKTKVRCVVFELKNKDVQSNRQKGGSIGPWGGERKRGFLLPEGAKRGTPNEIQGMPADCNGNRSGGRGGGGTIHCRGECRLKSYNAHKLLGARPKTNVETTRGKDLTHKEKKQGPGGITYVTRIKKTREEKPIFARAFTRGCKRYINSKQLGDEAEFLIMGKVKSRKVVSDGGEKKHSIWVEGGGEECIC